MNKEQQKDELILIVKKAIADNSIPFEDSDEFVELDGFDVDSIAEEVYEALYNAGYRKVLIDTENGENETLKRNVITARKETALKIRNYIKQHTELGDYYAGECYDELDIWSFDRFLKENFGVEVEE